MRYRANRGLVGSASVITAISATGINNIVEAQLKKSTGDWPGVPLTAIEYLVVAGGGGAPALGGGGGAGGVLTGTYTVAAANTYSITIGAGGTGTGMVAPTKGANTVFATLTSIGGGIGGGDYGGAAGPGGSGGGGQRGVATNGGKGVYPGSTYIDATRQGYDGGSGVPSLPYACPGGGGAGAVGASVTQSVYGAAGGAGIEWPTGSGTYYGGGGGGGAYNGGTGTSSGGIGGGGPGNNAGADGTAGTTNTGGGGGGGSYAGGWKTGGNGGSGVVIIRYSVDYSTLTSTTGSPTYTVSSGYRIYKWTSSGSFTI